MARDEVTFWLDPGCPWTWATSRWLVEAADQRRLTVRWRLLSLSVLNAGRIPEKQAERMAFGARVLRVCAACATATATPGSARSSRRTGTASTT